MPFISATSERRNLHPQRRSHGDRGLSRGAARQSGHLSSRALSGSAEFSRTIGNINAKLLPALVGLSSARSRRSCPRWRSRRCSECRTSCACRSAHPARQHQHPRAPGWTRPSWPGRHELLPRSGARYLAAVDPSGGGANAFTLAIVHVEDQGAEARVAHDVVRGWVRRGSEAPDLEGVVPEIAICCRRYGLSTVIGDRTRPAGSASAFGPRVSATRRRSHGHRRTRRPRTTWTRAWPTWRSSRSSPRGGLRLFIDT